MLDETETIRRYDKADALGAIAGLPDQLMHDYSAAAQQLADRQPSTLVLAGMGGSAQAGEFIKTWLGDRLPVPFVIVRDYHLPAFVDERSLVVVSSHSGNTEETLAALAEAESRGAMIAVITSGGKLGEAAKAGSYPVFEQPGQLQPRMAVLYGVRALVTIVERLGLVPGVLDELSGAGQWLRGQTASWTGQVSTTDNVAKQIAEALVGHVGVVYAGPTLAFAAMKWKIAFNENAKNLAFYNYFPEFNHNEFIGWSHPERSGLKVIELRSSLDHPQVQKRFEVSNRLLSNIFAPVEVRAEGKTAVEQLVWTIALGEYVACYLAFLNGVDPTPVELVEKLKRELA